MNDADPEKIERLLKSIVEELNFRLYAVSFNAVQRTLRVFIDRTDAGVTVDDCRRASVAISRGLDDADLLHAAYTLEVSSPGIDRPLLRPEHYLWALGKVAEIDTGAERVLGHIRSVDDRGVTIAARDGEKHIAFATIKRAKVTEET